MGINNQSYGGAVTFPVYFHTELETVKLVSKYEAVIIVLHPQQPKLIHTKQVGEYVVQYRAFQSKTYVKQVTEEEFLAAYAMVCPLSSAIIDNAGFADSLTGLDVIGATLVKGDIEALDRQKLTGTLTVRDVDTLVEYDGDVEIITNRNGFIKFGTITFDGAVPYSDDSRMGTEGFLWLDHTPEQYVDISLGQPVNLKLTPELSYLRLYPIGSPPVVGADFNDDFNNDFKIS